MWKMHKKPQYKLFELSFGLACINILDEDGDNCCVTDYPLIDGYRVGWGFTSQECFDPTMFGPASGYSKQPYDHTGNCKYAIGRLEV